MKILLSNDDGYQAPGLVCLAQALEELAEVVVVAPDRDRSGASNSLTLDNPVRAIRSDNGFYRVDGTPTDCVHLAITGLLRDEPDMVIAGINDGPNLGDDVLYSGTVAAAMEGRFLGFPALAVSLAGTEACHYASAVHFVVALIDRLRDNALPSGTLLNINVPDLPLSEIHGVRATRLGQRHKAEPVIRTTDPRGRDIYWVGPAGAEQDAGPGTDFFAIRERCISVTPLQVDLTHHENVASMASWLSQVEL